LCTESALYSECKWEKSSKSNKATINQRNSTASKNNSAVTATAITNQEGEEIQINIACNSTGSISKHTRNAEGASDCIVSKKLESNNQPTVQNQQYRLHLQSNSCIVSDGNCNTKINFILRLTINWWLWQK